MRIKLTDRLIETLEPPEAGRLTLSDTARPGLHLRIGSRAKSWLFEKRVKGGKKRRHSLGHYPDVTLAAARALALEIELEATNGIDRVLNREEERLAAERARQEALTVEQVLKRYATLRLAAISTGNAVERELNRALSGHLCTPIHELKRASLQDVIDAAIARGHLTYANRLRAYIRTFTKWAAAREYLEFDVGQAIQGAGREASRDRTLSLQEVRAIYAATFQTGELWGPIFRLLTLTGQRRGEILGLDWSEIDLEGRTIILPGAKTKNRKPHVTHLSEPALLELRQLKGINEKAGFVFTTTGRTAVSGISRAKERLDRALGKDFLPWRVHDLRRAMATHLAGAGVPEGVVDRIQNHSATGSAPSAVARVYQTHDLLPQRAAALDRWASLVVEETAAIVALGG